VIYTNIDGFITLQTDNKTTNEQEKEVEEVSMLMLMSWWLMMPAHSW